MISEGTSRDRTPVKLEYEPHVTILQHGYDVCAAKYGRLARLVPSETLLFAQNLEGAQDRALDGERRGERAPLPGPTIWG